MMALVQSESSMQLESERREVDVDVTTAPTTIERLEDLFEYGSVQMQTGYESFFSPSRVAKDPQPAPGPTFWNHLMSRFSSHASKIDSTVLLSVAEKVQPDMTNTNSLLKYVNASALTHFTSKLENYMSVVSHKYAPKHTHNLEDTTLVQEDLKTYLVKPKGPVDISGKLFVLYGIGSWLGLSYLLMKNKDRLNQKNNVLRDRMFNPVYAIPPGGTYQKEFGPLAQAAVDLLAFVVVLSLVGSLFVMRNTMDEGAKASDALLE